MVGRGTCAAVDDNLGISTAREQVKALIASISYRAPGT